MSSEEFSNFIYAIEHSLELRKEVKTCIDNNSLVNMASKYGFKINHKDLEENSIEQKISKWFETSNLN